MFVQPAGYSSSRFTNDRDQSGELNHSVEHVYHYVMELQKKVKNTDQKLEKLSNDFYNYLQDKLKMEQLQLAETRLIRVRQMVEKEFGHYDEIRRRATGMIQAVETGVVRDEIVRNSTEELMTRSSEILAGPLLSSTICVDIR